MLKLVGEGCLINAAPSSYKINNKKLNATEHIQSFATAGKGGGPALNSRMSGRSNLNCNTALLHGIKSPWNCFLEFLLSFTFKNVI